MHFTSDMFLFLSVKPIKFNHALQELELHHLALKWPRSGQRKEEGSHLKRFSRNLDQRMSWCAWN